MMNPSREYRHMARQCARLAAAAPSAHGRVSFLAASEHWLRLAREVETKLEPAMDAKAQTRRSDEAGPIAFAALRASPDHEARSFAR